MSADATLPTTSARPVAAVHVASRKIRKRLTSPTSSLIAVLLALAGAGLFMLRKGSQAGRGSPAMARALAVRVGLSITVFLFVLVMAFNMFSDALQDALDPKKVAES